jgi:two-component system, NarL family, sensor histidine kinase BarA
MALPVRLRLRLSLAAKCQLLFGAAVVLILTAALAVPWHRMRTLVIEGQEEAARRLADAWLNSKIELGSELVPVEQLRPIEATERGAGLMLTLIARDEFELASARSDFLRRGIELFQTRDDRDELFEAAATVRDLTVFRYARAIRRGDLARLRGGAEIGFGSTVGSAVGSTVLADPVEMVLLLQMRTELVSAQVMRNSLYLLGAGLLAGLLAIATFYFITMRIILSPVRVLRDTAERVSAGELSIRSDINTGDEFEQLSNMFNAMLESLKANEDKLRSVNKSLDFKVGELAQSNVVLHEANKLKSEFLANVSHELRTPLHSIIGFAEVLQETLKGRTGPVDEKRHRYIANIITSSRRLLDLINDLLDLAKIEAGRLEVRISPVSIPDTTEALLNLIRPQAEKKKLTLRRKVEPGLPTIATDPGKVQQILFNFLSNAVKFSEAEGAVTITAAAERGGDQKPPRADAPVRAVRVTVSDTGPGIALEDHERIFEKFVQLDETATREYGGTGLGLTISRDLAKLLGARIEVDSEHGRGAHFSLILPLAPPSLTASLMPEPEDASRQPSDRVAPQTA